MIFDTPFVTIPEIDIGGKYSNQVATLEAKIDALTLDMRKVLDRLDRVEIYGKSPGYTAFEVERDRQAGIDRIIDDEVA